MGALSQIYAWGQTPNKAFLTKVLRIYNLNNIYPSVNITKVHLLILYNRTKVLLYK